ncbi:MAG: aminoglycoside phosphotransferase [Gammaproteobacteria bacterium]|nr:MAG: aminoglycoside phosphotransferase [Gammaproteobacteria bacterium]
MKIDNERSAALQRFIAAHSTGDVSYAPASADASFRSYWRVDDGKIARIVMDAPPDKEDIRPWLMLSQRLQRAGLYTPHVHAVDYAQGFVLMEDLGARLYLDELKEISADTTRVDALYADACEALLTLARVDAGDLPRFDDAFMRTELELMPTWFLERHLQYALSCDDWDVVEAAFSLLMRELRTQPQGFMHRDFHSRNLMRVKHNNPGIIDFQGAMRGPLAYDLASLLRDCYIAWPAARVDAWVEAHRQRLVAARICDADAPTFQRWFDLAGLQRHLKVLGIFCRLNYRDGKAGYLADLPLVLDYVLSVARRYPEFAALAALIESAVGARDITQPSVELASA